MNIMIVDDSKMVRHMVSIALSELGYNEVCQATDVSDAKSLIKRKKIDLIIADWHMPGESGLDFLKWVKSVPEFKTIPFILQTTENEKKNIIEAVKAGVQGYLFKPVQKETLEKKLSELSKVFNFQSPIPTSPSHNGAAETSSLSEAPPQKGISGYSLADFALPISKQEFGSMFTLKTGSNFSCRAYVGNNMSSSFSKTLRDNYPDSPIIFLCDFQTEATNRDIVDAWEKELSFTKIVVQDIDKNRTVAQYSTIIDTLSLQNVNASAILVAYGDMPILSLAGFVSATYLGGLPFVIIPTTLASCLNGSIGESWILDSSNHANIMKLSYDPSFIWFDTSSIFSMAQTEYTFLCAEIFRYAFIGGEELCKTIQKQWPELLKKDETVFAELIRLCTSARASICSLPASNISKNAALRFAQPIAQSILCSLSTSKLLDGQALFLATTCLWEFSKRNNVLNPQSFPEYQELFKLKPAIDLQETLDGKDVFELTYKIEPSSISKLTTAIPCSTGCVEIKTEIPEAEFIEATKELFCMPG